MSEDREFYDTTGILSREYRTWTDVDQILIPYMEELGWTLLLARATEGTTKQSGWGAMFVRETQLNRCKSCGQVLDLPTYLFSHGVHLGEAIVLAARQAVRVEQRFLEDL